MFSLVRGGPKILLIESNNIKELLDYLKRNSKFKECDFQFAYENSAENYTILCLTNEMKEVVKEENISHVLLAKTQPDILLCNIINDGKNNLISKSRLAPRIIVMRAIGDCGKILEEIQKDHRGHIGKFENILSEYNNKGNVITLSNDILSNNISLLNTYKKALYVEEEYYSLLRSLRTHALRYVNEGLGNQDWHELEIKIYDRYGEYRLQYDRLVRVIDNLELGVILGESWGKDYPRFLMSVEVYRLRLFTIHDPKYIKKVLLALEYLEDGTRTVDYDLYYNRKKIDWTDVLEDKSMARNKLSYKYRTSIFPNLEQEEAQKIHDIEKQILKTRR
ncbi:hypothetical protein [Clostridium ganghwense]|uniref:Uncharacterized protein n=1 Tax=Clostridium ganghwense TaxID=312089 RepID=A0ABT4CSN9_9CLOT|nr:hypothetical protein [Clostridium ganghwense]MCY6372080.1 hypothetical protein [Clostridium ganghwense]